MAHGVFMSWAERLAAYVYGYFPPLVKAKLNYSQHLC